MKPTKYAIIFLGTFAGFCFGTTLSEGLGYHWSEGRSHLAVYLTCACALAAIFGMVCAKVRLPPK